MIKRGFMKVLPLFILCFIWIFAEASGFQKYAINIEKGIISVSFSIQSDESFVKALKEGNNKEVLVYADLFRHWDVLPDEFITGTKTVVDLYSDPLKEEYIATRYDGKSSVIKRFNSVESMLNWAFEFNNVKVASVKGYEDGDYYVKIKAEAYSDTVVSIFAKLLLIQPKDFSYEMVVLKFKIQNGKIVQEK